MAFSDLVFEVKLQELDMNSQIQYYNISSVLAQKIQILPALGGGGEGRRGLYRSGRLQVLKDTQTSLLQ